MAYLHQTQNHLRQDLDYILEHTLPLWEELRNQKIFVTGGTGFFGCWLLESFVWANKKLNLNASLTVLTRNKSLFTAKCPHLIEQHSLHFLDGDVRSFNFPKDKFSHVIHAAIDASAKLNETDPQLMLNTIIQGTARVLEFAKYCNVEYFLFVSSGAVYGKQPLEISHLSENYPINADSNSAYTIGKRKAEQMCIEYSEKNRLNIKIARCFAFVGPYLPLDKHFAIGNFILDGLKGKTIIVNGDGTPYRSYLYAADLTIWLWTILIKGKKLHPYNVGSDEALNIAEIAHCVARSFNPVCKVEVMRTPAAYVLPERYIPDISRVKNELFLTPKIHLLDAINFTKTWYLNNA